MSSHPCCLSQTNISSRTTTGQSTITAVERKMQTIDNEWTCIQNWKGQPVHRFLDLPSETIICIFNFLLVNPTQEGRFSTGSDSIRTLVRTACVLNEISPIITHNGAIRKWMEDFWRAVILQELEGESLATFYSMESKLGEKSFKRVYSIMTQNLNRNKPKLKKKDQFKFVLLGHGKLNEV